MGRLRSLRCRKVDGRLGGAEIEPTVTLLSRSGCGLGYSVAVLQTSLRAGAHAGATILEQLRYLLSRKVDGLMPYYPDVQLTGAPSEAQLGHSLSMNAGAIISGAPWALVGTHVQHGLALVWVEPQTGWAKIPPTYKLTPSGDSTWAATLCHFH